MPSNTFSLPSAGKSFTLSRLDFNNSILSAWSSFYGPAVPTIGNITIEGTASAPYSGMLYRSSIHKALYVQDSTSIKGGGIGGGFTRVGITNRTFESITTLVANLAYIEQSELCTTVGDSSANYRVYMKTNNSNNIVDVGIPPSSSLATSMFVNRQIANTHLQLNTITGAELASNIIYTSGATMKGRILIDALAERTVSTAVSSNVLDIDVGLASMHRVNVTSNINSIKFSNTNTSMSWGVSVVFYADGTAYNFNTNSNVAYPNSNTPITLTSTAGRRDAISFVSPDGGLPAMAFVGGQGF
jgi:hypothetical protein